MCTTGQVCYYYTLIIATQGHLLKPDTIRFIEKVHDLLYVTLSYLICLSLKLYLNCAR